MSTASFLKKSVKVIGEKLMVLKKNSNYVSNLKH